MFDCDSYAFFSLFKESMWRIIRMTQHVMPSHGDLAYILSHEIWVRVLAAESFLHESAVGNSTDYKFLAYSHDLPSRKQMALILARTGLPISFAPPEKAG